FPFRTNEFPFSALTQPSVRRNCLTAQGLLPVLRNSDAQPPSKSDYSQTAVGQTAIGQTTVRLRSVRLQSDWSRWLTRFDASSKHRRVGADEDAADQRRIFDIDIARRREDGSDDFRPVADGDVLRARAGAGEIP